MLCVTPIARRVDPAFHCCQVRFHRRVGNRPTRTGRSTGCTFQSLAQAVHAAHADFSLAVALEHDCISAQLSSLSVACSHDHLSPGAEGSEAALIVCYILGRYAVFGIVERAEESQVSQNVLVIFSNEIFIVPRLSGTCFCSVGSYRLDIWLVGVLPYEVQQ